MKLFKGVGDPRIDRFHARRRWARRLGWIIYGLLGTVLLAGVGAAAFIYFHYIKDLPDFTSIKEYRPPVITRVYARDGRLMGEFYAERRMEVPYARFPRHLVLAFVAVEDARFFEHPGVDLIGIVRAFIRNLQAGDVVQGGSTITQQVVKRILLTSEKSFARKIKEAVLAYRIDNYLTKEEILTLYLNHIFLGHGAYGVEAAAQEYFSKHVEDLTLAEAALLAGIPKAPTSYSPYLNFKRAMSRQAYVLERMAQVGFITPEQAQAAMRQTITLKPYRPDWLKECGYYTEHVRHLLEQRFGREKVMNLGLRVYTPADVGLHRLGQKVLNEGLDQVVHRNGVRGVVKNLKPKEREAFLAQQTRLFTKYPPRKGILVKALVVPGDKKAPGVQLRLGQYHAVLASGGAEGDSRRPRAYALHAGDVVQVRVLGQDRQKRWLVSPEPTSMVQGALVSMELKTGKVRTLLGGRNFADSSFNRATQAHRQAGSAFKPIIYAAAVEEGYGPNSIIQDSPLSLPGGRHGQMWSPQNYDHSFSGPITLATALARSRNVPAVRMMMALGVPKVLKMAKTLGITSPIYPNYASALGASEVTPLELTRAYSVFPNRGVLREAVFIDRIEDRDGRVLWEAKGEGVQVMRPESADTMTQLLLGVVERGTATRVRVLGRPVGGKTGTTNNTRDAWFIGFTPSLITGVWVGMDEKLSLGPKETGSQAAAPIFIAYMREVLKHQPAEQFPESVRSTYRGGEKDVDQDDEETEEEEEFYPENNTLTEETPKPKAPSRNFFKRDLEG